MNIRHIPFIACMSVLALVAGIALGFWCTVIILTAALLIIKLDDIF